MFDWFVWIDCELELFRELPDLRAGTFEIEGETGSGFSAEHDVFSDCHSLDQHEVLVDHADTERDRVVRRLDVTRLAVDDDLAAVGGIKTVSDAHRRRLTRAILADNGMDRPRLNDYVDMVVSKNVAESFRYLSEFEHSVLNFVLCALYFVLDFSIA